MMRYLSVQVSTESTNKVYVSHWGDYILEIEDLPSTIKWKLKDHGTNYISTTILGESLNKVVLIGLV